MLTIRRLFPDRKATLQAAHPCIPDQRGVCGATGQWSAGPVSNAPVPVS